MVSGLAIRSAEKPLPRAQAQSNIDCKVVAAYGKLKQELKKLGVEISKPQYNLEHPLGGCRNARIREAKVRAQAQERLAESLKLNK